MGRRSRESGNEVAAMKTVRRMVGISVLMALSVYLPACREKAKAVPVTGCPPVVEGPVRMPAVAGAFYPADPAELSRAVDGYLAQATPPDVAGQIRAAIVPHAGYVFSAPVAAYVYKLLVGRKYDTVVLIGNSHHEGYPGVSIIAEGSFRTPLGDVPINSELARKLLAVGRDMQFRQSPHGPEHSLEVQLPFLQKTLGTFKIVPILLGTESTDVARMLAAALAKQAGPDVLVIASTDLSHYPRYDDAVYEDQATLKAVESGDVDTLERTMRQMESMRLPNIATLMCGEGAVKTVMLYARAIGADRVKVLKYANSGDTAGSKDRCVGYGAVVFSSEREASMQNKEDEVLNAEERKAALELARLTVETYVRTGKRPVWNKRLPGLEKPLGAFVTLRENGELRGCIGRFEPDIPLSQVIIEMAIAAATEDHRFPPVSAKELGEIDYEISVLSPLRKVKSWKEIELGRHGVEVARGFRRGVYLPQVATETGWDLDTFMSSLCAHKAGLPADAWKDPQTDIYVFTAQVFSDHE